MFPGLLAVSHSCTCCSFLVPDTKEHAGHHLKKDCVEGLFIFDKQCYDCLTLHILADIDPHMHASDRHEEGECMSSARYGYWHDVGIPLTHVNAGDHHEEDYGMSSGMLDDWHDEVSLLSKVPAQPAVDVSSVLPMSRAQGGAQMDHHIETNFVRASSSTAVAGGPSPHAGTSQVLSTTDAVFHYRCTSP